MGIKIIRKRPRPGGEEEPVLTPRGYELADPSLGAGWHKVENATFTKSIARAADLIEHSNFAIRMWRKGKRPSLIRRNSLRIIRD
jgi:hypothetical protein